jgi:site-specific DNA recombinase
MNEAISEAVIYCRVSHTKQKSEGDGLHSQEHRCREYCSARGYAVIKVFQDDVSGHGDFMSRRGMVELLRFLDHQKRKRLVVVFDDLKRFARDTIFHLKLRQELALRNASVECLNFKFEATPEGMFVETVIAAQGELERHQIRRQTIQKMKARVEQGFYVFKVPLGYRYEKAAGQGKILVRDEPLASIVTEAIEGYATGRFELQADVAKFLQAQPAFPRTAKGQVRQQLVHEILTRVVYAGCVEARSWGVTVRKGNHVPLISMQSYLRVQERLQGKHAGMAIRANAGEDFPLRGLVICAECHTPLTACWSTGRWGTRYPYYLCPKRGCASYGKSIRRADIEAQFTQLIEKLTPREGIREVAVAMFRDAWRKQARTVDDRIATLRKSLRAIETQVGHLLDRVTECNAASLVTAYETRIQKLEEEKLVLEERISAAMGDKPPSFDDALRTAVEFLVSPCKLWESERIQDKRLVAKLAFAGRVAYSRSEGFRTPEFSQPFKWLGASTDAVFELASPRGFEPRLLP